MTESSAETEHTLTSSTRRYTRAQGAVMPFLPYGLVPVVGLIALLLFGWTILAHGAVQSAARHAATQALQQSGEDWANVRVSGQWVRLEGTPPSPEAADRAIAAVRRAKVPTWLGQARPVTRVKADFAEPASRETAPPAAPDTSPASVRPAPEYLFRLTAGRLTLDGHVASSEDRQTIGQFAESLLPTPYMTEITNRLQITDGPNPDGFDVISRRGIEGLSLCRAGTASFIDQVFSFRCEASDADVDRILALVRAGLPLGAFGPVEVLPAQAVAVCEEELSELLSAARIEFPSGGSSISVASEPVLDLAARAAADCPGTLRVEGHTDSTGNTALNQTLSLSRAESVRAALIARGVPEDRLVAAGYGATRPVGDNKSETGRARNRRIEIRIVRPDE